MTLKEIFHTLFQIKIAILDRVEEIKEKGIVIFHAHLKSKAIKCSCCGSNNVRQEASKIRQFRGCNLGHKKSYLQLLIYKFYCRDCKKKAWMKLPFTVGKLPMAKPFIVYVTELCKISVLLNVARLLDLEWKTIKNIHKAHLGQRPKQFSYKKLRYISIDEIAIKKGHEYMTIVTDIFTGQILHAVRGRKEEDLRPFLKQLAKKAKHLRGVAMDMSKSYTSAVQKHLPKVAIVFDRFHVTKVLTGMVDEVRKQEFRQLRDRGLSIGKGERFLFLRNYADLTPAQDESLHKLLEINKPLSIAYCLKEQFRLFWDCESPGRAAIFLVDWCTLARLSGVKEAIKAANTLMSHLKGLLSYFRHRIDNGKAEGINNKIKTMKRQSYGCRDEEYFKLKLYHLHKTKSALVGA